MAFSPNKKYALLSAVEEPLETLTPIGVFWDIENCSVPRGKSALALVQAIRDKFFTGHKEVEFTCACDSSKESKEVIQDLNYAQVTVMHINATSKNAADDKLRQSLRRFATVYPAPATVVLLSGDVNFVSDLSDLRHRHNLEVIVVHNTTVTDALRTCANQCYSFEDLIANLPDRSSNKNGEKPVELHITNLPADRDVSQLRSRLKQLSDNCGGKVVSITGSSAVVRFPNTDSGSRFKQFEPVELMLEGLAEVLDKNNPGDDHKRNFQQHLKFI